MRVKTNATATAPLAVASEIRSAINTLPARPRVEARPAPVDVYRPAEVTSWLMEPKRSPEINATAAAPLAVASEINATAAAPLAVASEINEALRGLGLPPRRLDEVWDLDSLAAVQLTRALSTRLGRSLPLTTLFNFPTPGQLIAHLKGESVPVSQRLPKAAAQSVAIVGVGCRLPGGVESTEEFRKFLARGAGATAEITRWDLDRLYDPEPGRPGKTYTRRAALVEAEMFDASFFGLSQREARQLDPQHRLLLEAAWHAFEDAGYPPRAPEKRDGGVFLGLSPNGYESRHPLGASPAMAAGRLSHFFNLGGPSLTLDTACSSALVAVHTAVEALRAGRCRWALAGGVHVIGSPQTFVGLSQLGVLAADGVCKSFQDSADGFGRGEGCGLVALVGIDIWSKEIGHLPEQRELSGKIVAEQLAHAMLPAFVRKKRRILLHVPE